MRLKGDYDPIDLDDEDDDDFYEDLRELMDELGLETQEEEDELNLEEVIRDLEEDLMLDEILQEMGYEPTY
jgi:DNA replication initiation complex subunit (GINS family)